MSDDLVKRLRKAADTMAAWTPGTPTTESLLSEAANYIENLEAYAKHERSLGAEPWMMENNELKHCIEELQKFRDLYPTKLGELLAAKQRIEALEEQLKTSRGLRASRQAMIEAQTQRIIELEHGNNKLRGINADLVEAHTFATDPANSHWQGNVIKQQCDRINELQAALTSEDADIADRALIARYKELEAVLREIAEDGTEGDFAGDIARRALEGK